MGILISRGVVLVCVVVFGRYGWCTESDADEPFTIKTEPDAFGCKDLKDGSAVLDVIRASRGSPGADDRKAAVEKQGMRSLFEDGRCVWFHDGERITPIGGPNPVWEGEPLRKTDWFFVRRDDKGTITTLESKSEEFWVLASDLDPEGVAEW